MTNALTAQELWIHSFHPAPEDAAPTLLCFPHAGGSASYFRPLADALGPAAEVLSLQYPGRQDRRAETPITSVPRLADEILTVLESLPRRQLVLFGHSMGACVAFEVARRIEQDSSHDLLGLVVSGRTAPPTLRDTKIRLMDDDGVIAEIRRLNGTDDRLLLDDDIIRMIMPAIRGDYLAVESYRYQPGPPLRCPVSVLVGDDDPQVSRAEAEEWREHTEGGFTLRGFPGGHFYLAEQKAQVAQALTEDLARFR
ncbi:MULTISPECIES: thioesterase II family protein [unclassified Streptomyces]|uniref:thioesterase II family protein n=1 Tax=unclassified Streptomyces TaxID=2593676 RepID=UPI002E7696C9|nr:alpha/beta fold hydrolase [Streptomyces sp. JV184]MEE1743065.1 alpha/beta fold hydrolase [Streptomyces sp. JV184]